MPTRNQHAQKAEHDEAFSRHVRDTLNAADFCDWEAIAVYYAALHLVDAKLANHGVHPPDHAARRKAVAQHLNLILREYLALEQLARQARYEAGTQITEADVAKARNRWYSNISALCDL